MHAVPLLSCVQCVFIDVNPNVNLTLQQFQATKMIANIQLCEAKKNKDADGEDDDDESQEEGESEEPEESNGDPNHWS